MSRTGARLISGLLGLWLACPSPAEAWGPDGHAIVGLVAEAHLCVEVQRQIDDLWGENGLVTAGQWPDRIRGQRKWKHTAPWHYVNAPDEGPLPPVDQNPDGDVLWAMSQFAAELERDDLDTTDRRQAVAFLAHFVADVHQPLHVGRAEDRGGNRIPVANDRSPDLNLHAYWDRVVIRAVDPDPVDYARVILPLALNHRDHWQNDPPLGWARESLLLRPVVYDFPQPIARDSVILDEAYAERAETLARLRLVQAGVRLAGMLNQRLGPGCTPPPETAALP